MSANPVQLHDYPEDQRTEFDIKGHPGKFYSSITCTIGTTYFTASNFGIGGLIIPSGVVGTASLSRGGTIPLGSLAHNSPFIWELSVSSLKVDSGTVYALIRNQIIR